MAKEKEEKTKAPTVVKAAGSRKAAKRNQELRRARKALKHLIKKHPAAEDRREGLRAHISRVETRARTETNFGKKERRERQQARERAKRPAPPSE